MRYNDNITAKPVAASVVAAMDGRHRAEEENRPMRILFVCLGNICRSPAAEVVFGALAQKEGVADRFELDSAGFYGGHRGELPDPRMRMAAAKRGLQLAHRSRTVTESDFEYFDLIIGMDDANIDALRRACPSLEDEKKIVRMTDFACGHPAATHVPDPYWEGADGFELVLDLLEDSCACLLNLLS